MTNQQYTYLEHNEFEVEVKIRVRITELSDDKYLSREDIKQIVEQLAPREIAEDFGIQLQEKKEDTYFLECVNMAKIELKPIACLVSSPYLKEEES